MEERNFDYNLLVVFETLFEEQHVSRAAQRLGLTQPAVSNALNRLREQFGDPLFVRAPAGMQPTPKAFALKEPVSSALRLLREQVFQRQGFDPKTADKIFQIATTDYGELVVLPEVCKKLASHAPNIRLQVRSLNRRVPSEELSSGELDLVLGFFVDENSGSLYKQTLFEETFVTMVRKNHPRIKGKMSLQEYVKERHLLVSPWGGLSGVVDDQLKKKKLSRRVVAAFPHFLIAPIIASKTDDVLTLPKRVAEIFKDMIDVQLMESPVTPPTFPANLIWHERTHHDPANQWLRSFIHGAVKEI